MDLKQEYHYTGGIRDFVRYLNTNKDVVNSEPIYFSINRDDTVVAIAIQYNTGYSETLLSYANNIRTQEGGTHEIGFKNGLTRIMNDYAKRQGILKENDSNLLGEDIREGMAAILTVLVPEPQFEGQTKTKLGNTEVRSLVETAISEGVGVFWMKTRELPAR